MTALLLDTHAWIWLAAGHARLAKYASRLTRAAASGQLLLSAASIYEAAQIGYESEGSKRKGKRAVVMRPTIAEWVRDAQTSTRVTIVPIDAAMALDAARLHALHGDPFDRLIMTAAVAAKAQLVTADEALIRFATEAKLPLLPL